MYVSRDYTSELVGKLMKAYLALNLLRLQRNLYALERK